MVLVGVCVSWPRWLEECLEGTGAAAGWRVFMVQRWCVVGLSCGGPLPGDVGVVVGGAVVGY